MNIILLLLLAYFLISLSALVDKFLLSKAVNYPVFYAVLISTIGLTALLLIPIGYFVPALRFNVPTAFDLGINFLAGGGYTFAIYFLYKALLKNDASRIFPFVGALTAVGTFVLSYYFLGERLTVYQIIAFVVLLSGGLLVSLNLADAKNKGAFSKGFGYAVMAGLIFAISYTAAKFIYDGQGFVSGFVWIRIFAFVASLVFLISAGNRKKILESLKQDSGIRKKSNQVVLVFGQIATGLGFLLMNYAISLESVSIVLAAQGLQYAYLLIIVIVLSSRFPNILTEKFTSKLLLQKVVAIVLIVLGLGILTI